MLKRNDLFPNEADGRLKLIMITALVESLSVTALTAALGALAARRGFLTAAATKELGTLQVNKLQKKMQHHRKAPC